MKQSDFLARHCCALASLHAEWNPSVDGRAIYCALLKIERRAHDATTAQCNGAPYRDQPFRPDWDADGNETDDTPWSAFVADVAADVAACFGGQAPAGFFLNGDARGYALKIKPGSVPEGMDTDWGGNGILAPNLDRLEQ